MSSRRRPPGSRCSRHWRRCSRKRMPPGRKSGARTRPDSSLTPASVRAVDAPAAAGGSGRRRRQRHPVNDRASSWIVGGELRWTLSLGGAERARARPPRVDAAARGGAEADAGACSSARRGGDRAAPSASRRRARGPRPARRRRPGARKPAHHPRPVRCRHRRRERRAARVPSVLDADAQRASALVDAITGEATLHRALGRTP